MDPRQLEVRARATAREDAGASSRHIWTRSSERQRRDLSGVRDRLSILAESEPAAGSTPNGDEPRSTSQETVHERAVVYFRLDADRRPLLAQMLAARDRQRPRDARRRLQARPVPTVVHDRRVLGGRRRARRASIRRARSAGISLILGTQELADLKAAGDGALREQVLGNVATVIAHRQNVPESAELIAAMAGTSAAWITTSRPRTGSRLRCKRARHPTPRLRVRDPPEPHQATPDRMPPCSRPAQV